MQTLIKINMLPADLRPKKTLFKFDAKFIMTFIVICGVIGVGGYYLSLMRDDKAISGQMAMLRQQEKSLQSVVQLQTEVENLEKTIAERLAVVNELTGDSDTRYAMLMHINTVLPTDMWLLAINESRTGGALSYSIEGMSYSKTDISAFIEGLRTFGRFGDVVLESIMPAPMDIKDAYRFVVQVTLTSSAPTVVQTAAKGPARRSAPSR